jgi:hypothetical protein
MLRTFSTHINALSDGSFNGSFDGSFDGSFNRSEAVIQRMGLELSVGL